MTTERAKAYEVWWNSTANGTTTGNLKEVFCAGWDALRRLAEEKYIQEGSFFDRAKVEALSEIKAKLLTQATAAFLDGSDAYAMSLRDIANNLGK